MSESAHPTRHARAVLLANFVAEEDGQEALQHWAAHLGLDIGAFGSLTTWRFMGSYKWGYKSPHMSCKYNYPTYNPTYKYPWAHEPPSRQALNPKPSHQDFLLPRTQGCFNPEKAGLCRASWYLSC